MTESSELVHTLQQPHWREAAHHWHHYGSPLRPCAADVRVMEEFVRRWCPNHRTRPLRALLWGVTPEIATMAWPDGTELLAVDKSRPMIQHVWPGDITGRRKAVCADWFEFDCGADRYDVVIGDGNFAILDFPRQYRTLAGIARDALASDGVVITRFFVQPTASETPEAVIDDLLANRIGSFHAFKLRLAMALQRSASSGARMGDVFSAWTDAGIHVEALATMTGWPRAVIETINLFDGKDSRLSFPSVLQMEAPMSEHFDKLDERYLPYELGERCPILSFRPRE
jgi:hypothetical protein